MTVACCKFLTHLNARYREYFMLKVTVIDAKSE